MASFAARALVRGVAARMATRATVNSTFSNIAARGFAGKVSTEQGYIPDVEGLAGRARQEAMYKRAYGEDLYDRDATAFFEEGTRENPIPIFSSEDERTVGISLPDDAEIRWFVLKAGELVYDPDTCNFFALKKVTQSEVDEWIARAEKQVLGGSK